MGLFRKRIDPEELARLRAELATLKLRLEQQDSATIGFAARFGPIDAANANLTQQVADLDARVTVVSTELANQLRELGNDIDGLAARSNGNGDHPDVTELRDGQARLANEQARYQIAFREDLARLAEQLRRARS